MLYIPYSAHNLPLVIFAHGFDNDMYEGANFATRLARQNIAVLCYDMPSQGERRDSVIDSVRDGTDF